MCHIDAFVCTRTRPPRPQTKVRRSKSHFVRQIVEVVENVSQRISASSEPILGAVHRSLRTQRVTRILVFVVVLLVVVLAPNQFTIEESPHFESFGTTFGEESEEEQNHEKDTANCWYCAETVAAGGSGGNADHRR